MKKATIGIVLLAILLMAAVGSAQLRRGDAAIYFRDGRVIYDHITGIVTANLIVQTPANGEFPLRQVWLINYMEDQWDYPAEREQMDANEHTIFLRNGNVASGQIVNFLSENEAGRGRPWGYKLRKNGQTTIFTPGGIARIYFSNSVPSAFTQNQNQNQNQNVNRNQGRNRNQNQGQNQADNPIVGRFGAIGNTTASQLQMNADGTARLVMNNGQSMAGTWSFNRGDTSIIVLRLNNGGNVMEMTFGRDGNDLVGLNYDKKTFGQLRFRR
jgi:hypothetical protein